MTVLGYKKQHLPLIRQAQLSECGHACVAMISRYHGHRIDLLVLRQLQEPGVNGSTLLDLMQLFERLKLNTRALRVDLNALCQVQCPAIIHWNMNHFVVLKAVQRHHVLIHDPAYGRRKIPISELAKSFTGIVLEVEPASDFKHLSALHRLSIRDIFKGIKGLKNNLTVLLMLSFIIEFFVLLNPLFLQYIIDAVIEHNCVNNLFVMSLGFIFLSLCHGTIEFVRSHFVVYLSNRLGEYFSSGIMTHLLKLPFSYFEKRHQGDILSRFYAISDIQNKMTTDSINTLLDGLVIVLVLMIMVAFSIGLTSIVVFTLGSFFLLRLISYQHLKTQTEISINEHANVNSKFLEIIQGMMSIKLFSKEASMYRSWKNFFINGMNANIKIARLNILYNSANVFVFNIEHILVVTVGAFLVMKNQYSIGMLLAFLAYRQVLVTKTTSFIQKIFEYKLIGIQLERVADILLHPQEQVDKEQTLTNLHIQGEIKIHNLTYRYPGAHQNLFHKFNYHIKPAEKIVITGPSGVGKSTLMKIMLGLVSANEGKILIDNLPIELMGLKNYRNICASVMQDDNLISGSILDNISFLDHKIDIDMVYQAAIMAQIHEDIINMTMGYETLIGNLGNTLSGGQKQRILLARALYKKPKLLFLDEATSHLDNATEIKINKALKALQITQIVIAHREESIKMADRLIVLK